MPGRKGVKLTDAELRVLVSAARMFTEADRESEIEAWGKRNYDAMCRAVKKYDAGAD